MKQGIKNTLIFITGAAVGSAVTTLALRQFYTKFINETLTEEVNKQMDDIKKEYTDAVESLRKQYESNEVPKEEPKQAVKKEKPVKKTPEQKKEESVDYTKYSEEKKKVKDPRIEAAQEIVEETTNEYGSYIIGFSDYTEDNGYEKVTATYYAANNMYVDDSEAPRPELNTIIGNLINLIDDYGEGDDLFVRDDSKETDYEIIFDDGSYGA